MSTARRVADGLRRRSAGTLLLELTVLVVGILLALAVDGWLERRRNAAVAAQSLELVRNDLVQLMEQADELEAYNRRVLEATSVVWSATDTPGLVAKDVATFRALTLLVQRRTVRFPKAAYEELVATGNLRALADPGLRAALVRFYEALGRDEEIILRNNEAFTDVLLNGQLIGEGLIINLPAGQSDFSLELQSESQALRSEYLPVGPTYQGRLWTLPAGHPDRVRLLSATASVASAAAVHLFLARNAREGAAALIREIDATLSSRAVTDGPSSG